MSALRCAEASRNRARSIFPACPEAAGFARAQNGDFALQHGDSSSSSLFGHGPRTSSELRTDTTSSQGLPRTPSKQVSRTCLGVGVPVSLCP